MRPCPPNETHLALRRGFADEFVKLAARGTIGIRAQAPPELLWIRRHSQLPPKTAAVIRGFIRGLAENVEGEREHMHKHAQGWLRGLGGLGGRLFQGAVERVGPEKAFGTLRGRLGAYIADPGLAWSMSREALKKELATPFSKVLGYGFGFGYPAYELYKGDIGPAEAGIWAATLPLTGGMMPMGGGLRGLGKGLLRTAPVYYGGTRLGRALDVRLGFGPEAEGGVQAETPAPMWPQFAPAAQPSYQQPQVRSSPSQTGYFSGGQFHQDPSLVSIGPYRPYARLLPGGGSW